MNDLHIHNALNSGLQDTLVIAPLSNTRGHLYRLCRLLLCFYYYVISCFWHKWCEIPLYVLRASVVFSSIYLEWNIFCFPFLFLVHIGKCFLEKSPGSICFQLYDSFQVVDEIIKELDMFASTRPSPSTPPPRPNAFPAPFMPPETSAIVPPTMGGVDRPIGLVTPPAPKRDPIPEVEALRFVENVDRLFVLLLSCPLDFDVQVRLYFAFF